MMKLILIIFFYLNTFSSFSQEKNIKSDKSKDYLNFLLYSDNNSQNHLFTFQYMYQLNPIGKTIGSQGMITSFGFNIARFFSKKIILGISLDLKLFAGFSTKKLSNEFVDDFNNHLINQNNNSLDSTNTALIKTAFNNEYGAKLYGNQIVNGGVMISLFPQKYGGILIHLKNGGTGFKIHNVYGNPYVKNGKADAVYLSVKSDYIIDITFKPYAFFKNSYEAEIDNFDLEVLMKRFSISFFYERLDFSSAEFNGTKISSMVDSEFNNKYRIDNRFGVKFGWGIY